MINLFYNTELTNTSCNIIIHVVQRKIEVRPVWKPMHLQPYYQNCEYVHHDDMDISKQLFENGLCLPSGSSLSEEDQNRVTDIILSALNACYIPDDL